MRVQILHDRDGTICAAFAPEGDRQGGLMSNDPEQTVIEVDAPEQTSDAQSEHGDRVSATLARLVDDYRVDSGRLVSRTDTGS